MTPCYKTLTHNGDPDEDHICSSCGLTFDHRRIRRDEVTLAHACEAWVELLSEHFAPCALPVHEDHIPHIGEVWKTRRESFDYSNYSTREDAERRTPMKLYPHQVEALEKLKNGSVLAGGVGTGKTLTALAYYAQIVCEGALDRSKPMERPRDLVVITTAKKRDDLDWEDEALHFGIFRDPEVSYSQREFIVDSWNNIGKYIDRENTFFIFDEQRLVGSGAWVKAFLKIAKAPGNEWILLSATPADTWLDYVPLFLAHGFYRNRTDFIEQHVVWTFHGRYRKVRGFFGVRRLEQYRAQILVEMPYERHTTRHLVEEPVDYDVGMFDLVWKKRWNVYDNVPLVDSAEMHRIGRKVVNSDPSRLDAIAKLAAKHDRLIIFYSFDYELEALRTLHSSLDIPVAEWNGHRHEPVPGTERWLYLVQYTAGAEGWNCITTDAIVFYSLTYSHKIFEQAQGRIDRLDSPYDDLWYYILMSNAKIEKIIWRALTMKKNFHEGRNIKFNQPDPPEKRAA